LQFIIRTSHSRERIDIHCPQIRQKNDSTLKCKTGIIYLPKLQQVILNLSRRLKQPSGGKTTQIEKQLETITNYRN